MSDLFVLSAQIFTVALALIAITKSYLGFRAKLESLQLFLFWLLTWSGIIVIAIFGGRSGVGTFFGMALVFLFFIVYRIYLKIERLEQNLARTIQELALRDNWKNK